MANILYDNCFIFTYQTKVKQVQEEDGLYWHLLEDTIFYVESGGMKSDEGYIQKHRVLNLKKEGNYVWHLLDVHLEGDVGISINHNRRLIHAQIHSAQHLLSGIMQNVFGMKTIAHHVSDYENDIEFDAERISDRQIHELQVIANGLIRNDRQIKIIYPTKKEALLYNGKSYDYDDRLRVVRMEGISDTPCGCIHVPSLRYLQMIYLIKAEKSSKGVKLKYTVGDQLLQNHHDYYNVLDKTGTLLAQPFEFIEFGVLKQIQENKSLLADLQVIKQKYVDLLLAGLDVNQKQIQVFEDMDLKTFQILVSKYNAMPTKPFTFIWKQNNKVHVVVAKEEDSKAVFTKISEGYSLRGGGNERLAQGGGNYEEGMIANIIDKITNNI